MSDPPSADCIEGHMPVRFLYPILRYIRCGEHSGLDGRLISLLMVFTHFVEIHPTTELCGNQIIQLIAAANLSYQLFFSQVTNIKMAAAPIATKVIQPNRVDQNPLVCSPMISRFLPISNMIRIKGTAMTPLITAV